MQISNATVIGDALGTTVTEYGIFQLSVTDGGAAVVQVSVGTDTCLMVARPTEPWTAIVCTGDTVDGSTVDALQRWAVAAERDSGGYFATIALVLDGTQAAAVAAAADGVGAILIWWIV